MSISKESLIKLYLTEGNSVAVIARQLRCSENKVNYYLKKHGISKRTISEAAYLKHNPAGDPFLEKKVLTIKNDSKQKN